jgi:lysylphosphatidylglycerol synthetase-like protein (DUF2156 family)
MYLLLAALILVVSAVLVYKKRFTSDFQMGGLYFVQLYYLLITPIVCTIFITLGQEILNRPRIEVINIPSGILFNLYGMFVILAGIASGIHSATTSIFQSFLKNELPMLKKLKNDLDDATFRRLELHEQIKEDLPTFHVNEKFHGGFSHNLLFISSIFAVLFLGLLELNHPASNPSSITPILILLLGVALGAVQAVAIIRSTFLSLSLISSVITGGVLYFFANRVLFNFAYFPVTTVALIYLIVVTAAVALVGLIFLVSNRLSQTVVKRIYPKEHWFQDGISVEVMKVKVKRDWE